ncbi:uncharacterized protein B0J16DRAFT_375184 [Fusarium flagelliforme]|uniref:uncharacterized protein n=1 Tax=Fusarium flagelliforme TaxID=2675880 RepID=UPI001E8D5220|nr:uncharacterized protein B0J16DRAFT_375184 [Fusarium flagelliforme]KAH7174306.1 hypothetical protein B0J16DRAFT_375184 [Fusarium flagelliforme]
MTENTVTTPYTPLPSTDPSATRLVKLSPAGFDEAVHCELETISLANERPYIALSYVWGDATDTVPILLNGVEHGVTRNLDSFLRHLQALLEEIFLVLQCLPAYEWPSGLQIIEALNSLSFDQQNSQNTTKTAEQNLQDLKETAQAAVLFYFSSTDDQAAIDKIRMETSRPIQIIQWNDLSLPRFWIDALCSNQNDLVERNKQVKRMNHIYRQTNLLLVWALNYQQPIISEVLAQIVFRDIELLCRKVAHLEPESSPITHESDITNAVRRLFPSLGIYDKILAGQIVWFFELEWFCRGWVLQEVALSTSKPSELWVGFKHISLSRLLVAGIAILDVLAELEPKNHLVRALCGMHDCPSWVPDFSCLQRYDTLCQRYPTAGMTYKHRIRINELLSIEEGTPEDFTAADKLELSSSLLRISCPVYWLQTLEAVIRFERGWEYPKVEGKDSPYDTELKRRPLMNAVSLVVLNSIHFVIQGDRNADFKVWIRFLERFAGQTLFDHQPHVILLEDIIDVLVESRFIPMIEGILKGCLGITEDGHLILGRRLNCLKTDDRIGFIPNSLETFIFRPCDSGYQFITNSWQSDMEELVNVQSIQLRNKEIVTII